jgi:hypothetical protein
MDRLLVGAKGRNDNVAVAFVSRLPLGGRMVAFEIVRFGWPLPLHHSAARRDE